MTESSGWRGTIPHPQNITGLCRLHWNNIKQLCQGIVSHTQNPLRNPLKLTVRHHWGCSQNEQQRSEHCLYARRSVLMKQSWERSIMISPSKQPVSTIFVKVIGKEIWCLGKLATSLSGSHKRGCPVVFWQPQQVEVTCSYRESNEGSRVWKEWESKCFFVCFACAVCLHTTMPPAAGTPALTLTMSSMTERQRRSD